MDGPGEGLQEKPSIVFVSPHTHRFQEELLISYSPDIDFTQSRHVQEAISFSFRKGKPYLSIYMSLF